MSLFVKDSFVCSYPACGMQNLALDQEEPGYQNGACMHKCSLPLNIRCLGIDTDGWAITALGNFPEAPQLPLLEDRCSVGGVENLRPRGQIRPPGLSIWPLGLSPKATPPQQPYFAASWSVFFARLKCQCGQY